MKSHGMLEDANGKRSPKRVWGNRCMWVGIIMAVISGAPFYNPSENVILYILGAGTTMLSITVVEHLNGKDNQSPNP